MWTPRHRRVERRLLARCARGDGGALAELYDATSAHLVALASRMSPEPSVVDDVVRASYLEAWRAAGEHDPERSSGLAWLLARLHRHGVERLRSVPGHVDRALVRYPALDAVELTYFGGLTHTEVDAALRWPSGTATARIRAALLPGRG